MQNDTTATRGRRSQDEAASALVDKARALAPADFGSQFRPADARSVLDAFAVERQGNVLTISGYNDAQEVAFGDFEKFCRGRALAEGDAKTIRTAIRAAGKGQRVGGRLLAIFLLARVA